jgi:hypothetical protein
MKATSCSSSSKSEADDPLLRRVGGLGEAPSTEAVRQAGLKVFDDYLTLKGLNRDNLKADETCTDTFFQEFGGYLVDVATKANGEMFMAKTATMYFSNAKMFVTGKFSSNAFMKNDANFENIRYQVAVQINRKRILAGLPINEKSEPIGRVCLKDCCEYLIRLNLKDAVDRRCILCFICTYQGRILYV